MRGKVGKRSSQALSIKAPNHPRSRKTPPCSKGIKTFAALLNWLASRGRKTPPCSKGIESTAHRFCKHGCHMSKDLALLQRDWNSGWYLIAILLYVERHRPVPKGLKLSYLFSSDVLTHSRKTPPCSKGIETHHLKSTALVAVFFSTNQHSTPISPLFTMLFSSKQYDDENQKP